MSVAGRKRSGRLRRKNARKRYSFGSIETTFCRLKDWRRVATRYDRCPKAFFFSPVALADTIIFWP